MGEALMPRRGGGKFPKPTTIYSASSGDHITTSTFDMRVESNEFIVFFLMLGDAPSDNTVKFGFVGGRMHDQYGNARAAAYCLLSNGESGEGEFVSYEGCSAVHSPNNCVFSGDYAVYILG